MSTVAVQSQAFNEFYQSMLVLFPEQWSLTNQILQALGREDAHLALNDVYKMACRTSDSVGMKGLPHNAFQVLAGHALSLLNAAAMQLSVEYRNPSEYKLS